MLKLWILFSVLTVVVVILSTRFLDMPIAQYFVGWNHKVETLGDVGSSTILMAAALTAITCAAAYRIVCGPLPEIGKAAFLALCVAVIAFSANDFVLKVLFGRPIPNAVLFDHAQFRFHPFHGDRHSGFPSGHAMMAASFAATFWRLHRAALPALAVLLAMLSSLLLVGGWHFLSDIIAGLFLGTTTGLVAGELWIRHHN